jgi:hypothetical protein
MEISIPEESVYYYECSGGRFRLVYFIPLDELARLKDQGLLAEQALIDLPDGVDLGCTGPDFAEFEELYGFQPPLPPEALQRAFFAILSSTRRWKTFRGSGDIPSMELEKHVERVESELRRRDLEPVSVETHLDRPTMKQLRKRAKNREIQQTRIKRVLRDLAIEGVDPKKTLQQQWFSQVAPRGAQSAKAVFSRLHQRRKGEDS